MDISQILHQHNLTLLKSNIFNKDHIFLVADSNGGKMILKTRGFDAVQTGLLKIAKSMEAELCFKVPEIIIGGEEFIALEYVEGENLNKYFNTYLNNDLNRYFKICKNIADDYQKIISKIKNQKSKIEEEDDLFESGKEWLFKSFDEWYKPIVENGLIEEKYFDGLREKFQEKVKEKGENFFGWCHKNIIGDHIIVSNDNYYLLDLNMVSRLGKNYYDFLRALDWMILKSADLSFDAAVGYMKKYLSGFDWEEVKLVFAFRCIGILGCDIIKNGDKGAGDFGQKKADLIRFIRMNLD